MENTLLPPSNPTIIHNTTTSKTERSKQNIKSRTPKINYRKETKSSSTKMIQSHGPKPLGRPLRLCLRVWSGGEGKALEGWKYRGNWKGKKNQIFSKSNFLENDKLMLMVNIFYNFKNIITT